MVVDVAQRYEALFVDQNVLIPDGREYFGDMVHLAPAGASLWVDNVMAGIEPLLGKETN